MIRGILFEPGNPLGQHQVSASSMAIPMIAATISFPRFRIRRIFGLLVDSGADITSLHLRDAVRALGLQGFHQLSGETVVGGVGGDAKYFVEPATITFVHDDGSIEDYDLDLRIAKIPSGPRNELRHALRFPIKYCLYQLLVWNTIKNFVKLGGKRRVVG